MKTAQRVLIGLIAVVVVLTIMLLAVIVNMRHKRNDLEEQTQQLTTQREEQAIQQMTDQLNTVTESEPVEQEVYMSAPVTKAAVVQLLTETGLPTEMQTSVGSLLETVCSNVVTVDWQLYYNKTLQDVTVTDVNNDPLVTVFIFDNDSMVAGIKSTGQYWYATPDYLTSYEEADLQQAQELFNTYSTWDWTLYETCGIIGYLEHTYPVESIEYYERGMMAGGNEIMFNNAAISVIDPETGVGKAIKLRDDYELTSNTIVSADVDDYVVLESGNEVIPFSTFNFDNVYAKLQDDGYNVNAVDLARVFETERDSAYSYWDYDYADGVLTLYLMYENSMYSDGYSRTPIAKIAASVREGVDGNG